MDADTAVLHDVPMIEGGRYSLNLALFFDDGYAYSDYVILEWPGPNFENPVEAGCDRNVHSQPSSTALNTAPFHRVLAEL